MQLGWEASHKEFCSQSVEEERKVRDRGRTRLAAGCDWLDERTAAASGGLEDTEDTELKKMKELCKKGGAKKKMKELCKKGGAKKKEVKEGNMLRGAMNSFGQTCELGPKRSGV